jgi:hypothetical protein
MFAFSLAAPEIHRAQETARDEEPHPGQELSRALKVQKYKNIIYSGNYIM